MATGTANRSYHSTITTGGTAETVTLGGWQTVEVLNRDTAAEIYFTTDGTAATSAGDGTYVVEAGQALKVRSGALANVTTVSLISATTGAKYSVTGIAK